MAACGHSGSQGSGKSGTSHAGKAAAGTSNAGQSGATGGSAGSTSGNAGNGAAGSAGSGAAGSSGGGRSAGGSGGAGDAGDGGVGGEGATGATAGDDAGGAGNQSTGGSGGRQSTGGKSSSGGAFAFAGEGGSGAEGGEAHATKIDLLFVIDNSISMYEKQNVLNATIPKLVGRIVDPWCTDDVGPPIPPVGVSCTGGRHREMAPVTDMHVGVITTSLGAHGSHDVCSQESADQAVMNGQPAPPYDDQAHFLPKKRPGLPSWNDTGFLKWDPQQVATPPGHDDASELIADMLEIVGATRAVGCGYEATLEAVYRFLVDPEPPLVIDNNGSLTTVSTAPDNIDQEMLDERAAFLRPDSAVVVVTLSDEDDCSINDANGAQGWLVGWKGGVTANSVRMTKASSACADDPNDACCRPCQSVPASGCPDNATDPVCSLGTTYAIADDSLNLRCFDQRRRFGVDLLHPLSRYADGLTAATVPKRSGGSVTNPLFAGGRDPKLVIYAPIVGIPWQDLALDPSDTETIDFATARQIRDAGRWPVLVGDYDAGVPPVDPFMVASVGTRVGLTPSSNPFTGDPIVASGSTDPLGTINGHEMDLLNKDDLQYACIFPLPVPITCDSSNDDGCDCDTSELGYNRPVCQPPGGGAPVTTQYFGKAYPGIRHLEVARRVGDQAIPSSICARNTTDANRDDFGYVPAMRSIQARLTEILGPPP